MINIEERINAFASLGNFLGALPENEFQTIAERPRLENPWFTIDNVRLALMGISSSLKIESLREWLKDYSSTNQASKKVAIVMAGNIPLVGFHDLLCVLISGHTAVIKVSSKDSVLMKFITNKLIELEPRFQNQIQYVERLTEFDAVIATGSDNSSRYFDYYFGKYPNIIRKNRTSIAILDGMESDDDLKKLGFDIFSYFGLGCRNVSKLFVPGGYSFTKLFESWESYHDIIHHHKYCNNYDYQKSIMLVNSIPFLDNNFVMITENERMVSPISVIYFEYYNNEATLIEKLKSVEEKIQCVVGKKKPATIPFGEAQCPKVWDYADHVDTLKFLEF